MAIARRASLERTSSACDPWLNSAAVRPIATAQAVSSAPMTNGELGRLDWERAINGGSRSRPSIVVGMASVDDAPRGGQTDDEEYQEQHEEQGGEELRNRERRAGYGRESEQRRNQSDHQEYQSHV